MMERVGAKDNNAFTTLSFSEQTLLNGILKAFVYGIRDSEVPERSSSRISFYWEVSLKSLHLVTESANQAQQEIIEFRGRGCKSPRTTVLQKAGSRGSAASKA